MDNSSNIAFALVAGFVFYITVKGELPAYLCVIGIGSNCYQPPADKQTTTTTTQTPTATKTNPTTPQLPSNNGTGGGGGVDSGSSVDNSGPFSSIGLPGLGLPTGPGWELPSLPAPQFPDYPGVASSSVTGYGGGTDPNFDPNDTDAFFKLFNDNLGRNYFGIGEGGS